MAAGWRFELYSFDFAAGAILLATIAAWTFGTFGSDLSFVDRVAVAGLRSQAFAMAGGFIFSIGNTLLMATIALLGMSAAFPLVISTMLVVWSLAGSTNARLPFLTLGVIALVAAAVLTIFARYQRPARKAMGKRSTPDPIRKSTKGIVTGIMAGILMGLAYPLAEMSFWGDLGLGAYAGLLMFCIGMVISTALFSLYFLNIAIEGGRLPLSAYLRGTVRQHLFGLAGGALWAVGTLCWLLAQSTPLAQQPGYAITLVAAEGSVLLAVFWGMIAWGEFRGTLPRSRLRISLAIVCFCAGLGCLAFQFSR
ncbi:MAG TPA: hypothetical protein VH351_07260 [Bryobacteraceae bacterium]|jgi:glucose uptake protein|nr:hypothetical protein [Bryobacteraceae bacterium]